MTNVTRYDFEVALKDDNERLRKQLKEAQLSTARTDLKTNLTQDQLDQLADLITLQSDDEGVLTILDVKGDVLGSVWGNVEGDVLGSVWGSVWGNVEGDVLGSVWGNVEGDVLGSVWGNVEGDVWGSVWGSVAGSIKAS